jgi:hypothetical protein
MRYIFLLTKTLSKFQCAGEWNATALDGLPVGIAKPREILAVTGKQPLEVDTPG